MKKLFVCLMVSFFMAGCINFHPNGNHAGDDATEAAADDSAMQNSPHLRFKNVPIDGTLDRFVARMERGGFKVKWKTSGRTVLRGDFADFRDCVVHVETLKGMDLVSSITVSFPDRDQWETLYGDYRHLKELLTTKYGKPASCVEKFQTSYSSCMDDNAKMHEVFMDRCKYRTRFATDKGEIILQIAHDGGKFVMLTYKDKINGSVIKNHAIEDL